MLFELLVLYVVVVVGQLRSLMLAMVRRYVQRYKDATVRTVQCTTTVERSQSCEAEGEVKVTRLYGSSFQQQTCWHAIHK